MIVPGDSIEPIEFDGLEIRDYTAGIDASSSFAVIEVPPGGRHREAYSQSSDKYYYVLAGSLRFTLDREERNLAAGDFCLVRQGQHFGYENRTPNARGSFSSIRPASTWTRRSSWSGGRSETRQREVGSR